VFLARQPDVNPKAKYNAACVFALAAADPKATPKEQDDRARTAIDYLWKLKDEKYFQVPLHHRELREDHDLDKLRDHAEFRRLIAAVADAEKGLPSAGPTP
jgi:hypothetical protein